MYAPVMDWGDSDFGIHVVIYIALVVFFFCLLPIACYYVRIKSRTLAKICPPRRRRRQQQQQRQRHLRYDIGNDRQGGSLNTSEDRPHNRYGDIFFIEPSSEESARIRSQLEKDDKELPSYDEVMRMCNLTTPTAAAAAPHSPLAVPSPIGIAALPAPPYSESDPYAGAAEAGAGSAISPTVITMEPEPSTSRAAQIPTTTNVGRGAPLTLPNTASNTEV
ncbi:uncharacterized protein LOC6602089 isoform X2 [Drosophila persimilis]|uniref:uncharacterized protein LOC6602089 isoform X2 n=1 Tax=Drosophila persimilis TaxID=7234 RepID=UPI000F0734CF|nr:uncharacterized protein LOC6602089 isoform X2 [Drosophila persimilis]